MFMIIIAGLIGVLYLYLKYHYNFWQRLKVPGPPGEFFFGNVRDVLMLKKNMGQQLEKIYSDFKDCDLIGFYKFLTPAILLRSPELVHKMLVVDFDHFQSNDFHIGEHDELTYRNTFMVTGAQWRKTRNSVTPAFTSGKLKSMVPFTLKASENMIQFIKTDMTILSKAGGFDARDMTMRYTTDNIASVAFGLEANSFDRGGNTFMEMSQRIFNLDLLVSLKFMIITYLPSLAKLLKLKFIDQAVQDFFTKIIDETIQYRKETSTSRNDILNQFLELRKKLGDEEFGEIDVIAQSIQMIVNGSETTAATMGFILYFLTMHPDVQEKARKEVDAVLKKHNDELSYDAIKDMEYMDQILNETLRIYPATAITQKVCTKTYTFPETENTPSITVKPGTPVMVAPRSINLDKKYYPDPEKFDPERFSPDNIASIPKNVFKPFGDGPRLCLGQRFAIIQMKLGMARLLREFEITLNKSTILPVQISPRTFLIRPVNPIYVNFTNRRDIVG